MAILPGRRHRSNFAVHKLAFLALLCLGWAALTACGHAQEGETGGIGGTAAIGGTRVVVPAGGETGGIGGTGIAPRRTPIIGYGPIQRFGSVFVNGREFAISGRTLVTINGSAATIANLRVGDIAEVSGVVTGPRRGIARTIAVRDAIIGPVSAVVNHGTSFRVLGQTVVAATAGAPFSAIKPGDFVSVSAQRLADGRWAAQRVSVRPARSRFRLEAMVSAVGPGRVVVAGTTIEAPRTLLAGVHPGQRVAVVGIFRGAQLVATEVRPRPVTLGAPGTRIEVQNYFRTAGAGRITAADGMVATGPLPRAPLTGLRSVVVSGRVTTAGTITIQHIMIDRPAAPDLSGVAARSAGGSSLLENQEPGSEITEPQTNSDDEITQPDAINAPAEIEPPEVNEPNAPTPEIEPPEIETPQVEEPPTVVEPPEIDTQPDK